jgi:hypothetical protein
MGPMGRIYDGVLRRFGPKTGRVFSGIQYIWEGVNINYEYK